MITTARDHELRSRDKKTHKMTKDGLVEYNVTTGEEVRVSQRGQDFRLRAEQEPGRDAPGERQADPLRRADSVRRAISSHRESSHHHLPNPDRSIPNASAKNESAAIEDTRPIERIVRDDAPEVRPVSDPSQGVSDTKVHQTQSERSGRLQFDTPSAATPAAKTRQRGTQYQRRFVEDAAENTSGSAAAPSGSSVPDTPTPNTISADTSTSPDSGTPDAPVPVSTKSKLQFSPDEKPSVKLPAASKQLQKAQKAAGRLDAAGKKLPASRHARMEKTLDADSGHMKRRLHFEQEVKNQYEHISGPLPLRPVKAGANAAVGYAHTKLFQVEHENVGVQAAHKAELMAEGAARSLYRLHKTAPYRRVSRLQSKAAKANIKYAYRQALEANPKLKSNILSRLMQKL